MRRRDFISLIGGAAATWPLATRAQQGVMKRVGVVTIQSRASPPYAALTQRLRELGYVEGQNLILDFLNPEKAGGNTGAIQELVRRKVDVMVVVYEKSMKAAVTATTTVPIVMVAVDFDPLALGYIKSLAHPGGNVTGVYLQQLDLAKKRVELLTEALPSVHAGTVFWDSASETQWKATRSVAAEFGLQLADVELRDEPYNYDNALAKVPPDHRSFIIFPTSPVFFRDRHRLADFAVQHKIATLFGFREWVDAGGLFSYGVNFPAMYRRVAEYVDMVARGAKPADLPVEQPTEFELVINLKTAKALGLTLPPTLVARANEVIE